MIIFLLPSLFSFVFVDLLNEENELAQCFTNATVENINSLMEQEEDNRKNELSKKKEHLEDAASDRVESEKDKNDKINADRE